MTIITKPISEKKIDKLEVPLVENDQLEDVTKSDVEAPAPVDAARFVVLRARARRVSTTTTLCLLITSLIVVSIGIVGGTYLYRHYAASMQVHHLWCRIPYKNKENALFSPHLSESNSQAMFAPNERYQFAKEGNSVNSDYMKQEDQYWMENIEIDFEKENYERIDVPDFRDGRRGRFIHDFNSNITGIIDMDDRRCFVMPLNRHNVLPPRSLFDLIHKIWDGYYKVNTDVVRQTMRVVTPPITDMQNVGTYIARECKYLPVYRLEKNMSPVFKRSADLPNGAKFAQFSGNNVIEFDIVNLAEAIDYEKKLAESQR